MSDISERIMRGQQMLSMKLEALADEMYARAVEELRIEREETVWVLLCDGCAHDEIAAYVRLMDKETN